jgi:hypothetical protein
MRVYWAYAKHSTKFFQNKINELEFCFLYEVFPYFIKNIESISHSTFLEGSGKFSLPTLLKTQIENKAKVMLVTVTTEKSDFKFALQNNSGCVFGSIEGIRKSNLNLVHNVVHHQSVHRFI